MKKRSEPGNYEVKKKKKKHRVLSPRFLGLEPNLETKRLRTPGFITTCGSNFWSLDSLGLSDNFGRIPWSDNPTCPLPKHMDRWPSKKNVTNGKLEQSTQFWHDVSYHKLVKNVPAFHATDDQMVFNVCALGEAVYHGWPCCLDGSHAHPGDRVVSWTSNSADLSLVGGLFCHNW